MLRMVWFSIRNLLILVYVNNHTSVYGSWFRDGHWGYACCHQFLKNSYCTGTAGVEADQAAARLARGEIDDMPPPLPTKKEPVQSADNGQIYSEITDHMKRKRPDEKSFHLDGRKTTAGGSEMISEEEYEDYRRNKIARSDDPLLAMKALEGGV
jgi:pre-mRNA-processing factor SLU7